MHIFDITLPVSAALVVWPGDPAVQIEKISDVDKGDSLSLTQMTLRAHVGTHLDAPCHFIKGGSGVEALDLNLLVGTAYVAESLKTDAITASVLDDLAIPANTQRLLLHTRNSDHWTRLNDPFDENYVAISPDGAQWIVDHGIKLVGIDYVSVGSFQDAAPTHYILLGAGVIAVEGLNLAGIIAGEYQLYCLPMKLVGADGAPVRAILTRE